MKKLLSIFVLMFAIATISAQMILRNSEPQTMQATTQNIEVAAVQVAEPQTARAVRNLETTTVSLQEMSFVGTVENIRRSQRAPRHVTPLTSDTYFLWPARNFTATETAPGTVQLSWEAPQAAALPPDYIIEGDEFTHIDWTGDGFAIGGPMTMGHRYTSEQLVSMGVAGAELTEVDFWNINHVSDGTSWFLAGQDASVVVRIGIGGTATAPQTIVYESQRTSIPGGAAGNGVWNTVELTTPVGIPFDQDLWIMIEFIPGGTVPARFLSTDAQGTQIDGYNNLLFSGGQWIPINQVPGLATVTGGVGIYGIIETANGTATTSPNFLGYQVWRGDELLTTTPITELTFNDTETPGGFHLYTVRAIYTEGMSQPLSTQNTSTVVSLPWHQNFEVGGIPLGWAVGFSNAAAVTWTAGPGRSSAGGIIHRDHSQAQTSMLITNAIEIPADGLHELRFWQRWIWGNFHNGSTAVWVSTTDNAFASFSELQVIPTVAGGGSWTPWSEVVVSLEAFAGETIYLAFRYAQTDGSVWAIDDVSIELLPVETLSKNPADNATNIMLDENIVVTFNQDVTADNLALITINPTVLGFTPNLVDDVLTITHDGFAYDTEYTVTIPAGAIEGFAGTTWTFETTSAALTVLARTPGVDATNVALDANLVVTFNQYVDFANGFAGITITYAGGTVDVTDATIATRYLTITHAGFDFETEYTVTIPAGTIDGYDEVITWSFTTRTEAPPIAGPWLGSGTHHWWGNNPTGPDDITWRDVITEDTENDRIFWVDNLGDWNWVNTAHPTARGFRLHLSDEGNLFFLNNDYVGRDNNGDRVIMLVGYRDGEFIGATEGPGTPEGTEQFRAYLEFAPDGNSFTIAQPWPSNPAERWGLIMGVRNPAGGWLGAYGGSATWDIEFVRPNDHDLLLELAAHTPTQIPVSQIDLPIPSGVVTNIGLETQNNIVMSVTLNGDPLGNTSLAYIEFDSVRTLDIDGTFNPVFGPNTLVFTVEQDETDQNPANNVVTHELIVTQNLFAMDDNEHSMNASWTAAIHMGNIFTVTTETDVNMLQAAFFSNVANAIPGLTMSIRPVLPEGGVGAPLVTSEPFARPAEGPGWMNILIPTTTLEPGLYFVSVLQPGTTGMALAGSAPGTSTGALLLGTQFFTGGFNDVGAFFVRMFEVSDIPMVVSTAPARDAENVVASAPIVVTFSIDITEEDLALITIDPPVDGVQASIEDNVLTITHGGFAFETVYTVTIPAGAIENFDTEYSWSFTTAEAPLAIVSRTPDVGATGVALDAAATITFNRNIVATGTLAGVTFSPSVMATSASVSAASLTVVHGGFAPNTQYTVTIPANTLIGQPEAITWSFTTGAATSIEIPTPTATLVTFYPNPVEDILHIETTETVRQIEIFNLQGALVMTVEGNTTAIDVSNLPAGTFMIRFITETGVSTQRFVKR